MAVKGREEVRCAVRVSTLMMTLSFRTISSKYAAFEAVRGRGGRNRGQIRGQEVNIDDVTKFQSDQFSRWTKCW